MEVRGSGPGSSPNFVLPDSVTGKELAPQGGCDLYVLWMHHSPWIDCSTYKDPTLLTNILGNSINWDSL
jgi:hypothetical protein